MRKGAKPTTSSRAWERCTRGTSCRRAWALTAKLTADGRTILRASYGRFSQGVLTGELSPFHPGVTPITTRRVRSGHGRLHEHRPSVDPKSTCSSIPTRARRGPTSTPIGIDREVGRRLAVAVAYIRKNGSDFIGWTDVGGQYREEARTLRDGRPLPVFVLVNSTADRRFLLTNPDGYSLTYNGLVVAVEKRRSKGWQAFGSYTFSRTSGLQASSGATAAGAQVSTVATPNATFGRDPNDLTNARGRLPNDRPHMFRVMGSSRRAADRLRVAANLQHFSGKPWAATAQIVAAARRAAHPARTAGVAPAVVANAARPARVEDLASAAWDASSCSWTCSMCSTTGPPKGWRPTICSARISVSPPSSWIRAARCSA